MRKVVLLGDSIRMGYQPLVTQKLAGKADVWGPGENGRHSLWELDHFQPWVAEQQPDVLHVNFGIHDAVIMEDGQFQILPDQYRLCLRRFIKLAKDLGTTMIWATTTPRYTPSQEVPPAQWPKMKEIDDYNAAALEIVKSEALPINDLHQVIIDNGYAKCLSDDGCHMSDFGNDVLSDAVVAAVTSAM